MKAPETSSRQQRDAHRKRSGGVLLALVLASVTLVGCANSDRAPSIVPAAAEVTTPAPTPSPTKPEVSEEPLEEPLEETPEGATDSGISVEVWDAVNKFNNPGALPFVDNYGGVTFGFDNVDSLVVFLTERTDSLETEVRNFLALPEEKVSFRDADISWDALNELNLRVQADMQELYDRLLIVGVGIGPDMKVVISSLCSLTEEEMAGLRHTYGEQISFEVREGMGMAAGTRDSGDLPVMPDCGD